jgi:hypothetical protein
VQFELLADLWRHSVLEVVPELQEEFLARDHDVALPTLVVK